MEFLPVVEVVQVDRIIRAGLQAASAEDARLGVGVVVVSGDGIIQRANGVVAQRRAVLRRNPRFELRVRRFLVGDVAAYRFGIKAEARDYHAVVARADAGIAICDFAGRFEAHLLPQTRQMQHAQRAFGAGTNKRNNFTHKSVFLNVRGSGKR